MAVACLLLGACATQPTRETPLDWPQRQAQLAQLDGWKLSARMLLKTPEDAVSGGVDWTQTGEYLDFQFRGPLGSGTLLIEGAPGGWQVRTSRGEAWQIADPRTELGELLGWDLPLASLRYWAVGLPDPDANGSTSLDPLGRLATLDQDVWSVRYLEYRRLGELELPRKLEISGPDLRLRLVIRRWELGS